MSKFTLNLSIDKLKNLISFFLKNKKLHEDSIYLISTIEQVKRLNPQISTFEIIHNLSEKFELEIESDQVLNKDIFDKNNFNKFIFFNLDMEAFQIKTKFFKFHKIKNIFSNETFWLTEKKLTSLMGFNDSNLVLFQENLNFFIEDDSLNHNFSILDTLKNLIELEKKDIWNMTIYSIAIGFLYLVIPVGIQSLISILNFGTIFQPVVVLTLLVILALGFASILNLMQFFLAELIQQRIYVRVSFAVSKRISKFKHSYFEKKHPPELANYFLDIANIQKSFTLLLTDGLAIALQTIIGLLIIIVYHPFFIILDILIFGILYYTISNLGKNGIETSIKESKAKFSTESWLEEISLYKNAFRSTESAKYSELRLEENSKNYVQYRTKHYKILFKQIIGFLSLQVLGSGLLLCLGGYLVIKGEISLGQFIAAEIIIAKILDKFPKFGKYLESYYDLSASIDKINHLLEIETENKKNEVRENNFTHSFQLKFNSLGLIRNEHVILEKIDFEFKTNCILGIYGEVHQGKSSFIDLLYGIQTPTTGTVSINDQRLSEIDIFKYRNYVSYFSELEIFSGTILDNIRVGKFYLLNSEIREALARVKLEDKVSKLEQGIDTEILRNHYPFVKEDLYKLMFARIFASRSKLILLDDVLKYLDKTSKDQIIQEFDSEKKNSIILITSSNKEELKFCDEIIELKNGKIKQLKV